ncbi:MAG: DUF2283 domain-containing protein [Armatimonadetes bacterium]|nr:DUF2283 domain-containing protein [Armatimonadota bacterium]
MKVTYDEQVDAVYCYLSDREAARTIQVTRHVLLDLDSDENLRGISILSASRMFPGAPFVDGLLLDEEMEPGEWPLLLPMGHAG